MKKPKWLITTTAALIVALSCTACTSPGSTDKSVKHNDTAVTSEDTHNHKSSDETNLEDKSSKDNKKSYHDSYIFSYFTVQKFPNLLSAD